MAEVDATQVRTADVRGPRYAALNAAALNTGHCFTILAISIAFRGFCLFRPSALSDTASLHVLNHGLTAPGGPVIFCFRCAR